MSYYVYMLRSNNNKSVTYVGYTKDLKKRIIYSDSVTAMSWVRKKRCQTKLKRNDENDEVFILIDRATKWLKENNYSATIRKWETKKWGEIPADFGRK